MTEQELVKAIKYLKPTSIFSFSNADYSTIQWESLKGDAPTQDEIDDALETVKAHEIAQLEADAAAKAALLNRLGITADEAKLLLA
jgi:DNA-directed RNA polymerase specialized sigma54-like protein